MKTQMILVSIDKVEGTRTKEFLLDYQPHINREIRFIEEEGVRNIYTVTKLRSYPQAESGISLTGWWIDRRSAFYLKSRGVV